MYEAGVWRPGFTVCSVFAGPEGGDVADPILQMWKKPSGGGLIGAHFMSYRNAPESVDETHIGKIRDDGGPSSTGGIGCGEVDVKGASDHQLLGHDAIAM